MSASSPVKGIPERGLKKGGLKTSQHAFWISRVNRETNGKL